MILGLGHGKYKINLEILITPESTKMLEQNKQTEMGHLKLAQESASKCFQWPTLKQCSKIINEHCILFQRIKYSEVYTDTNKQLNN